MTEDVCVILPTIRHPSCLSAYLENARRHGFDTDRLFVLFITEDHCDTAHMHDLLQTHDVAGAVADERFRRRWFADRELTAYLDLIPEASHAQTSFGLAYLWAHERFGYGVMIDDDTAPRPEVDFFGRHLTNLQAEGPMRSLASSSHWVNVLHDVDPTLYPRGYPYGAMAETVTGSVQSIDPGQVVASQGLWTGVPDLDAVRILATGDIEGQSPIRLDADEYGEDFVTERGQYLTVCSMNLAFRREIVPAFYQLPMDDNPWGVGRFDDIWSGVFLKRVCDALDMVIRSGSPYCRHDKAPRSTFGDLASEAAGLELNEHLWHHVDDIDVERAVAAAEPPATAADGGRPTTASARAFATGYAAIADGLDPAAFDDYHNGAFLEEVTTSMRRWLELVAALEPHHDHAGPKQLKGFRSA